MSILLPLPATSMIGDPFADYLNVTVPLDFVVPCSDELRPLLDMLGVSEISEGVYSLPEKGGTFKISRRGKVGIFSASGGFLGRLRDTGNFSHYLAALASFPHRVSMLHLTQDYVVSSPPEVVLEVKRLGHAGELALTRKRIEPGRVKSILNLNLQGEETGTVYLGHRANADVWAKIYDKRHERLSRGLPDPGSIVRVELAVQSDVGATLRDAAEPASIFFNFASRSLAQVPEGTPEWSPYGEGYVPSSGMYSASTLQRLAAIMDTSLDVSRLVRLARADFGDGAFDALMPLLRARCRLRSAIT